MKKYILILFLIGTFPVFAQFNLSLNGSALNDNDIILLSSYGYPQSNKSIHINNTTAGNIKVRIKVTTVTNTDGTNFQLCTNGICYNGVTLNALFPPSSPMTIATANYGVLELANLDAGNGTDVIDYGFRVYQQDLSGNEIGTPINFTYRFDPNLSSQTFDTLKNIGIQIENTLVSQDFKILATQNTTVAVYDINGRALVQSNLKVGENVINVQNLTSGMYVASFSTEDGKTATAKIMVK